MHNTNSNNLHIFNIAHAAQQSAIKNRQRRLRSRQRTISPHTPPSKRSARQVAGDTFEKIASQHLEQAGLTVLARQLACPFGEIDLVLRHGPLLVFVEVRARNRASHGGAAASVTTRKQIKLIRTAKWYLPALTNRFFAGIVPACRIDVMTFDQGRLQWLKDAIRLEQDK